jgi:quercetin dioxygenase-like cupin family protein
MIKKQPLYCDFGSHTITEKNNTSRLYKYKSNFTWKGIKTEHYKPSGTDWADIARQTLIGNHGESVKFHVRYFEIASGGYSNLEMHKHEHVVIGIRGKGICVTGKKKHILNFLDTLYIGPGIVHQLKNPYNGPFGFFCIVNAKRDKPNILSPKPS